MLRVRKTESDAGLVDRQLAFFEIASSVSPKNVTRIDDFTYEYDFVVGQPVPDPRVVWRYAFSELWKDPTTAKPVSVATKISYVEYVKSRLQQSNECLLAKRVVQTMERHLLDADLTPAHMVHGDMTLENAVLCQGRGIVFIDPGDCRGLWCREIDEAKILQSLSGWERIKWPSTMRTWNDVHRPFEITYTHRALELSHWARLIAHPEKHDQRTIDFAMSRVESLLIELGCPSC